MSLRKPYRSVNEQLRILRSRGMAVDAGAGHVLRREGYYPIVNGYKDLFLDRKACLTAGDDRYGTGARFDDLYALFLFDRELRELLFSSITRAEAALKAVCAHEFTGLHPDEVNPYLNPDYYDSRCRPSAMALIDKVFKRILELDGNPRNRGDYGGKAYIRHCMEDHNGQVPLWVLANDLSFGQTVWFFQVQSPAVRLAVAESFTGLYADTHDRPRRITIKRLDSIFNRLVFYRNLCAHDERCYCARYDGRANENVYQAIGDLGYLLDKDDYLELFGRFSALVARVTSTMPSRSQSDPVCHGCARTGTGRQGGNHTAQLTVPAIGTVASQAALDHEPADLGCLPMGLWDSGWIWMPLAAGTVARAAYRSVYCPPWRHAAG